MKILVVYYSKTGNTKRAATDIAAGLGAALSHRLQYPGIKKQKYL